MTKPHEETWAHGFKVGDTRYLLVRKWELRRCVFNGKNWDVDDIVASATCEDGLTAANMLLTGRAEMGLARQRWGGWAKALLVRDVPGVIDRITTTVRVLP